MRHIITCLVAFQIVFVAVESAGAFNAVKNSVRNEDAERLNTFINNGASPNMIGPVCNKSLLMWGALSGATKTTKMLLDRGADPNISEKGTGMTALMYAVKNNNKEVAKLLVDHNADKYKRDSKGRTAMDMAKAYGFEDLLEVF